MWVSGKEHALHVQDSPTLQKNFSMYLQFLVQITKQLHCQNNFNQGNKIIWELVVIIM